ncbi:ABC transporter ATP-binding protein [Clostridium sp. 'White wine YQ']|uniref:ABC transporter ATP-binding protein n=1 Tax=Clostridium sp. 'White wine YQ' TaxID=3027474 RepID=UPI0023653299|nr:ABC transporter ATP-binding protein [Clostridium sp. 'White wine YQ']MDD7795264.1 ABC transporter ATP-binding protein [Clostridium sp. 'White wine YQ']
MGFLNKYIKRYWKLFFLAVLFLTLEAMCDLLQPTIMSRIVDVGVAEKNMDYVIKLGGIMLLVTLAGAIAASTRNIIATNVSQNFGAELRLDLYKKIQSFSSKNIDEFDRASLITRLTNDVNQIQVFANGLMRIFVKAPLLCIGSLVMVIRLNYRLALILLAVIPVVAIIISMNMKIGYPLFRRVQKALDKVNSIMREYLSGIRVVKAFNRFSYEENRFGNSNEELSEISTKAMKRMAIFSPAITFTVNLGIVAVIWLGGVKVNQGQMQVGQIIAFVNYMTQILFSLMIISNVFNMLVRAKASAERIEEVFSKENTMIIKKQPIKEFASKGKIDFINVSFSYSESYEEKVLNNISFSCLQGETLGIIGSTGSGKSTLVNLIPRFYDAIGGEIRVDDIDVKEIDTKVLREKIAIVPQKTVLFTGTISENIRWGNEKATKEHIEKVSDMAQIHSFIEKLPDGYETLIGQGGVNFSGGQKQRISIARALVRDPEILILDDCTSALDVTTEAEIREELRKYSSKLTTIIIAQRITSVMNTDRTIVLDKGEIVGIGTHKELMKECETYQEIFKSQIGKEAI